MNAALPAGAKGIPAPAAPDSSRTRLTIELTPALLALLDHVSEVLGTPKSQLALQALVQALPALVEQADGLRKRSRELQQQGRK